MADITVTAASVHLPNETEVIKIRGTLGAVAVPGSPMYLDGTNGWKPADADAAASGQARGILLSLPNGSVSGAIGDACDIVTEGRITGYASMTPGAAVFVSTTAGKLDQTAPADSAEYVFAIGWAESAVTIYVHPQITVPTVNAS
jgi:hypothetical protein